MTKFYPHFFIQLGEVDQQCVYIQGDDGTWYDFNEFDSFTVTKKLNQMSEFEFVINDIKDAQKLILKEYANIMFFSGLTLILKGRIQTIEYGTAYDCTAKGYGQECLLADKEIIKNNDKRIDYLDTSIQTVAKEIISVNTNGITPWIIEPNISGLFLTNPGTISVRYEYSNRLNAISSLADAVIDPANQKSYEWWVENDQYDYDKDWFYMDIFKGNQTSVKSYNISGVDANCTKTSYNKDMNDVANYVDVLGYGDGINQLKTNTYNASNTNTFLSSDITVIATTINVINSTGFLAGNTIRIASEQITIGVVGANQFTGCTRGINSTTAKIHKKGVYLEKYYASSAPEIGSSIDTYGLLDYSVTDKELINEANAELIATRILLERKDPIETINIIPNEAFEDIALLKTGDKITIVDSESSLNAEYRVVGLTYSSNYGDLSLQIDASNSSIQFTEQMYQQAQKTESIAKYMQGSTNVYAISEAENCDATHPLYTRFYIPSDIIKINKVLLVFQTKKYRAYEQTTISAGSSAPTSENNSENTVINASVSLSNTIGMNDNTWTNLFGWTNNANDTDGMNTYISQTMMYKGGVSPAGGNGYFHYRLYNSTNNVYYPDIDGMVIAGGYTAIQDIETLSGNISYFLPGNLKSKTFTMQTKWTGFPNDTDFWVSYDAGYDTYSRHTHTVSIPAHAHDVSFAISEETFPTGTPILNVIVGIDFGAEETTIPGSPFSISDEQSFSFNITDEVKNLIDLVGKDKWMYVYFTPNNGTNHNRIRIEANTYIKLFIESK